MKNSSQNIDLRGLDLPQRLCELREARRLTQADLGEKAGLSYRTVHDLELGKRKRVQEKTLMLLAAALDVPLAELTGLPPNGSAGSPTPSPDARAAKPGPHWKVDRRLGGLFAVVLLAGCVVFPWRFARSHSRWEITAGNLVVRDGLLGTRLWQTGTDYPVKDCTLAPWSDHTLLVQFTDNTPRGKILLAVDRSTGKTIWQAEPDLAAIRAAFGADVFDGGNIISSMVIPCDLDGDGEKEILVKYLHTENYPGILAWFDRFGNRRGQYANHGQFNDVLLADLDGDGFDDVIASGTDNARVYAGATVVILDKDHFRGASVDSLNHPDSTEPDSCLVRLVIPNWPQPYMEGLRAKRLHAYGITVLAGETGPSQLTLLFGSDQYPIGILHLDTHLIPHAVVMRDQFLETLKDRYPPELITGTGPADPAWRATWLAGYLRFGSGLAP